MIPDIERPDDAVILSHLASSTYIDTATHFGIPKTYVFDIARRNGQRKREDTCQRPIRVHQDQSPFCRL